MPQILETSRSPPSGEEGADLPGQLLFVMGMSQLLAKEQKAQTLHRAKQPCRCPALPCPMCILPPRQGPHHRSPTDTLRHQSSTRSFNSCLTLLQKSPKLPTLPQCQTKPSNTLPSQVLQSPELPLWSPSSPKHVGTESHGEAAEYPELCLQ